MLEKVYLYHTKKDNECYLEAGDMIKLLEACLCKAEEFQLENPQIKEWLNEKINLLEDMQEDPNAENSIDIDVSKYNFDEDTINELYGLIHLSSMTEEELEKFIEENDKCCQQDCGDCDEK